MPVAPLAMMPPAPMVSVTAVPGTWLLAWLPCPLPNVMPFQKLMVLLFCVAVGGLAGDIRRRNRLGTAGQVERVNRRTGRNQRRAGVGRRVVLNIVGLLGSAGHAASDGAGAWIRRQLRISAIGDDVIRAIERRPIEVISSRRAGDGPSSEDAVGRRRIREIDVRARTGDEVHRPTNGAIETGDRAAAGGAEDQAGSCAIHRHDRRADGDAERADRFGCARAALPLSVMIPPLEVIVVLSAMRLATLVTVLSRVNMVPAPRLMPLVLRIEPLPLSVRVPVRTEVLPL